MKKTSENKRKKGFPAVIAIVCLLLAATAGFLTYRHLNPRKIPVPSPAKNISPAVHTGKGAPYDPGFDIDAEAFVVYMYDARITGKSFTNNLGLKFFQSPDVFDSFVMMRKYITDASEGFPEDSFPRYFILGIDPYAVFRQSCSNKETFEKNLEFLYRLSEEHTGTAFHIYLPSDSALFWNSLPDDEKEDAKNSYITLVRYFKDRPNVMLYYVSTQEWVLYSGSIRTAGPFSPILGDVYDHLLALDLTQNDLRCMVTWANISDEMDRIIHMSSDYEQAMNSYADLTGKNVFFLGDSIFGNYRGSTGVSGFFGDMTGANVYNLSEGGWSAKDVADPSRALGCAFEYLLGKETEETFEAKCIGLDSYAAYKMAAPVLHETTGKDSLFIVEYGLNDYFSGVPSEKYREALDHIITGIKEAYPEAQIVVLSPGYVRIYEDGNEVLGNGTGAPLQEYRDISAEVALEADCMLMYLTDDFGFTLLESPLYLLPDNVHYNERGRYRIAQCIARMLQ